jgi:hypothetical protein
MSLCDERRDLDGRPSSPSACPVPTSRRDDHRALLPSSFVASRLTAPRGLSASPGPQDQRA